MLLPKKTKFRKSHTHKVRGHAQACNSITFGRYGIKILDNLKITSQQIEAVRKVVTRTLKRSGVLYMRIFPQIPVTKKPLAVRMGGGKGAVEKWIAPISKGTILMEVDNVPEALAKEAFEKAKYKLSVPCTMIKRRFIYID